MQNKLASFEAIVRRAFEVHDPAEPSSGTGHPFDARNIHPHLPATVCTLFDNGHYAHATFEAFKYLDKEVQKASNISKTGSGLMMSAFGGNPPPIKLNPLQSQSEIDEQDGFKFIFAGAFQGIRNPRGHEVTIHDDPDTCLDHLVLVSTLLRKLEEAGIDLD